jgi:hypothetical protein
MAMALLKGVASARADAIAAEREAEALLEALRLARADRARAAAATAGSAALTLACYNLAEERMGLQAACHCREDESQALLARIASDKERSGQLATRQLMQRFASDSFDSLACPGNFDSDIGGCGDCFCCCCGGNLTPLGMSVLRAESEPMTVRAALAVRAAAPAAEKTQQSLPRAGALGYMRRIFSSRQLLSSQSHLSCGCRSWEDAPPHA